MSITITRSNARHVIAGIGLGVGATLAILGPLASPVIAGDEQKSATPPIIDGLALELNDGSASVTLNNIEGARTTNSGGLGDLTFGDSPMDQLWQIWFWYRTGDDAREYALSNRASGGGGSGPNNRLVYLEPANDGQIDNALLVELELTLIDLSTENRDRAQLQIAFRLQNLTSSNLNVQFFAYATSTWRPAPATSSPSSAAPTTTFRPSGTVTRPFARIWSRAGPISTAGR